MRAHLRRHLPSGGQYLRRLYDGGNGGDYSTAAPAHQGAARGRGAGEAGAARHAVGHAVVPDVGRHGECVSGDRLRLQAGNDLLDVTVRVSDQGRDQVVGLTCRLR